MYRFSTSHLFWLILLVAVSLGWWLDRSRLAARNKIYDVQVKQLQRSLDESWGMMAGVPAERHSRFATGADFLEVLDPNVDYYEFQDELELFSNSPSAEHAVPLLIDLLRDENPEVRVRAYCSLGRIKRNPRQVVPLLIEGLDDPFPNAAWHAANALGAFGPDASSSIDALNAKSHDDSSRIATYCGLMLVKVDPSAKIETRLIELTRSPVRENRWRAIEALVDHVPYEKAEKILTERFQTEQDEEIRSMIAASLNRVRGASSHAPGRLK